MAILVVDDSRAMRMIVRRELRKAGYEDVVEAENGAAALSTMAGTQVDLVLSDWNMPDMNGLELLEAVRRDGNQVVFGFVTSETAPTIRGTAFEHGASFVITKPFSSEDLDREITLALGSGAEMAGASTDSGGRTLDKVLGGLLGRDVAVAESEPPAREVPRGMAEYTIESSGATVLAVAEMPLAASLGCALARIPASEAAEWGRAHAFNDSMESNFFEVANVLSPFASANQQRSVLRTVRALLEGEITPEMKSGTWHTTMQVSIEGYPPGRLGFVVQGA